jgi:hypothetical protein
MQVLQEDPPAPRRVDAGIPRDLEAICLKAMAKDPGRRYASATKFAEDIGRFLNGEPVLARPPGRRERFIRRLRRHRQTVRLTVGVTAAAALVTVAIVWAAGGFAPREIRTKQVEVPIAPEPISLTDEQKVLASAENLAALASAIHSYRSFHDGRLPPWAWPEKGKPLLSWRVLVLPYLDQDVLFKKFKLDESWDSPHNRALLPLMPKVFSIPGTSDRPDVTYYQLFVSRGGVTEPDRAKAIRLDDIRDGLSQTAMLTEAAEPIEWARPGDIMVSSDPPFPRFGGIVTEGVWICFADGSRSFLKKEIYQDEKTLRALVGRDDNQVVRLADFEVDKNRLAGRARSTPADSEKKAANEALLNQAARVRQRGISKNNLFSLQKALSGYAKKYGTLPPPAITSKDGRSLLSWRVSVLPFIGPQQDYLPLYKKFKLDEPWDGPTNKPLLSLMPKIFAIPDIETPTPHSTYYQLFTGPGAYDVSQNRRTPASIPDGSSNTIALAEAFEAVPWTAPADLQFTPDGPLPRLGGPFPEGFHAAFFDGSVFFLRKKIYENEADLRALIGWSDGQLVDVEQYDGDPVQVPKGPIAGPSASAFRFQSMNNLKQLAIAVQNYYLDHNGSFPPYAIPDKSGKPLLSWRVALLPYLQQRQLYERFKLDETWDSENNKKLLPFMPQVYSMRAVAGEKGQTFYQGFVGTGALFDPDPRKVRRLADVSHGVSDTLLFIEAGTAVPWTKPEDLTIEDDQSIPKIGGLFSDGFHTITIDGVPRFNPRTLLDNEKTLRAMIGIRDGAPTAPKKMK